jgi:hypothetical protein
VLADCLRVLRRAGRLLFTNAVTLAGLARREQLLARSSSMGDFVFTPGGLDERLVCDAGFVDVRVENVSENAARVAGAWRDVRERRRSRTSGGSRSSRTSRRGRRKRTSTFL